MSTIFERLRGFRRDQSGQIAFVTLFGAVVLVGLLGLVMTTGDQASLKIQAQNSVDAAALSGGSWIARGLNLTSAINVLQTQLIGGAIGLQALYKTLIISEPFVAGMCEGYTACSIFVVCIPLAAVTCFQSITALPAAIKLISPVVKLLARCSDGLFWVTARALQVINTAIHVSFFAIAMTETLFVAQANGVELAVLLPGPLFHGELSGIEFLPTKIAEFPDLCDPMDKGSPTRQQRGYSKLLGYPVSQGPLTLAKCRLSWASAFVTGFPPIGLGLLPFLANLQRDELCGGASSSDVVVEVDRPAKNLAECRRLGGNAHWWITRVETEPVSDPSGCAWFARQRGKTPPPYEGINNLHVISSTQVDKSCSEQPTGDRIDDRTYCSVELRQQEDKSSPPRYLHSLTIWTLETASVKDRTQSSAPPGRGSCSPLPRPYLLRDDNDALKFFVVARRSNRGIFFSTKFLDTPPTLYTYAQVEVYSGISADTFNQDWRVRLDRADLLEKPFERLGSQSSGVLADLARATSALPINLPQGGLAEFTGGFLNDLFGHRMEDSVSAVLNH